MTTLLVASTGGHLRELHALHRRFALDGDVHWATFDTPQSRSLLQAEHVHYVTFTASRDARHVVTNVPRALHILGEGRYERVVSTGSAIALSFLPAAAALGLPAHYIESAARSQGPSLTGRLLVRVPGVRLHTQYADWAEDPWRYGGSVFDAYKAVPGAPRAIRRVVVMVGTLDFGFRRLVKRLTNLLPPDAEILWQTGSTDTRELRLDARPALPAAELRAALERADLVIAHAGIGSALDALEAGRRPVLVPRREFYDEHVDDHQTLVARELSARGLAITGEAHALTIDDLHHAMGVTVRRLQRPRPFALEPSTEAGLALADAA
jgi:UDP-N-acetylglucosamine--N-acetylmuramyl-(pentapeptide) pyrophosphoryl-undecaprenol N-acetylglucosamine transferase